MNYFKLAGLICALAGCEQWDADMRRAADVKERVIRECCERCLFAHNPDGCRRLCVEAKGFTL